MAKGRRRPNPGSVRQGPATTPAGAERPVSAAASPPRSQPARSAPPPPDARSAERIQRQRELTAARARAERMKTIRGYAIGVGAFVVIAAIGIWALSRATTPPPGPVGREVPIASWEHIADGQKATDFNSVPPTSGQHYANPANAGIHDIPIQDEVQVHNLEHGQIMIQYTCTDCPALVEQLKPFAERYKPWVLVAPYPNPNVGGRIALTSWGRIDVFDEFDEARIVRFIESNRNKGRENVIAG
jgi:hypothetical protein